MGQIPIDIVQYVAYLSYIILLWKSIYLSKHIGRFEALSFLAMPLIFRNYDTQVYSHYYR